ncbi:hypothetical protein CEE37_01645 [candidate division LCP-89 bacterium B3_LCP]|uniref:DUF3951 domain-containing protein n=1 Tax=candidate division LCP-89 bacterium B3_LCP TaxID=2012998 RepID=A0A532V5K8_UNCL8|nr:MAG: hypothetical protein CEE37_01645 [candidate division LCP-89 bacterium B3_LCP]
MESSDLVFLGVLVVFLIVVIIWVYKKRNRLFFNAHFTAETTMMNYQDAHKVKAMEQVSHMKEEKEEDDEGEGKET